MVSHPPWHWRVLSASSLRNLWPTLFPSFSTLAPPSNCSLPAKSQSTKNHFLHLLSLCHKIENLKPLKSLLIIQGFMSHEPLVGEFIRLCFHLGVPNLALSTFGKIHKPSLSLKNLMVQCLCKCGLFEDVLCVYHNCVVLGCSSDNYTFPFVLKACSALGDLQRGQELHCFVLKIGFGDNLVVQTALVDLYAKCGHMGIARLVLDEIPQPDLVSWNALISGYSLNGYNQEAFDVFREIRVMGLKPNVSTLASIIPICTRLGIFDIGKSVHGLALKCGHFMDDSLTPALISLYAFGGDLSVARDLFECLPTKNVAIWNAMISAYTQNKKSSDAFEMFRRMLQVGLQPNAVTFVSIIPSCEKFGINVYGESIHALVIKDGLDSQLTVVTALLSMYAKFENIKCTKFLFDQMPQRNLLSWNSIISGYGHNRFWDASLDAFREMQCWGFNPDAISIICILSACCELEAIRLGKSAHAFSLKKIFDLNLNVSNALLAFYSNSCQLSSAFKLFSKMVVRNHISWNTMISGCVHSGEERDAVALFHQMQQEGIDLDLVTLVSVLPCYNETKNLVQGMAVHGYAIKIGFASDVSLANALISMYICCGELGAGKLLFKVMSNRDVISWNALITGYRYHNLQDEVMTSFGQMMKEDQKPNYVTLLNVLPMCYTQLQGKSIHGYATRAGIVLEAPLLTSLISMYARFKNIDSCMSIFEIGEKSISLWNAIMSVHAQTQDAKKAVAFFCQLLETERKPDYITILSLVSACVQLNNLNLTNSVMAYIIQKGFDKNVAINNSLIDLYARCGDISMARNIFNGLLEKDSVSWSVMINGHGLHGDGEAALALFSQMRSSGMKPDYITYVSILSACSHAGLVEEGRTIFNSMGEHGISPRMQHYACMINLLGRTGHLNEAYGIVKNMPDKPSVSLLDSLLGACVVHDNVELGEEIGRSLLEMDPENSGSYVMLYNVYAAAGRWTDANRVRSNMEGRELRKVPGFSVIEGSGHYEELFS